MWFKVELPQPAIVTEVQFDSSLGRPRRPRRPGAAPGAPRPPAPVVGYPRGYTVQVSTDGTTWSKPVAEGKGEGARTTIAFAPTRAKFVRITQTDTVPTRRHGRSANLRVYEAPASRREEVEARSCCVSSVSV